MHKGIKTLDIGEYLTITNKVSGDVETILLPETPFRIGYVVKKKSLLGKVKTRCSFGNDYGVDDSLGGRVEDLEREDRTLPMLSRQHCGITLTNGTRYIHDLGSRTGTYVNGERISPERMAGKKELKDGDVINLIPSGDKFLLELKYWAWR